MSEFALDDLLVLDTPARGLLDLSEADVALALNGVTDLDADGDETGPEIAFPIGVVFLRHDAILWGWYGGGYCMTITLIGKRHYTYFVPACSRHRNFRRR
jgi:hypothetical protein